MTTENDPEAQPAKEKAILRRCQVPGGWLYQARYAEGPMLWSSPTFVPSVPEPEMKLAAEKAIKFATSGDDLNTIRLADVVVDLKSGTVIKNRFGKSSMIRGKALAKRKRR